MRMLFDPKPGLPQFTILGVTFCWRDCWDGSRGLEVVIARRWRVVYLWHRETPAKSVRTDI